MAARDQAAAAGAPAPDAASPASLAHDLRGPLLTVRSYLELVAEEPPGALSAEVRDAVERAARAAAHAQSVLEATVLEAAVQAAGREEAAAAPSLVDLDAVVRAVVDAMEAEIAATSAQVEIATLPPVLGDAAPLSRVFSNLIENALRHGAGSGPPRVTVSATVDRGCCTVSVRDRGPGIAPGERERIFASGVRGASAAGTPGGGLGLATVRGLISRLGGRVWVDPEVTDGACVRISLPAPWPGLLPE